jgi:hypothetical protein
MKLLDRDVKWEQRSKVGKWKYELKADATYSLGYDAGRGEMLSPWGKLIASWGDGILVIKKGYAWDGMTGYPDSKRNKKASLAHDIGYQMSNCGNSPFTKKIVDSWLYDLQASWWQKRLTLFGVESFGKLFWGFGETDCYIKIK